MIATLRNFNRSDGRQRDGGFAPGVDERMARRARQEERENRAALRRAAANPVRGPRDEKKIFTADGELDPLVDATFLAEAEARVRIHLARGHFEQAKATIDELADQWQLFQIATNPANAAIQERMAWHVSNVFDVRTAHLIEEHCTGTIGALLECFPASFVNNTKNNGCGPGTVRKIAETLLKIGVIDAAECQKRIDDWQVAMNTR